MTKTTVYLWGSSHFYAWHNIPLNANKRYVESYDQGHQVHVVCLGDNNFHEALRHSSEISVQAAVDRVMALFNDLVHFFHKLSDIKVKKRFLLVTSQVPSPKTEECSILATKVHLGLKELGKVYISGNKGVFRYLNFNRNFLDAENGSTRFDASFLCVI